MTLEHTHQAHQLGEFINAVPTVGSKDLKELLAQQAGVDPT